MKFYVLFRCVEFCLVYKLKFQIDIGYVNLDFRRGFMSRVIYLRLIDIYLVFKVWGTEGDHSVLEKIRGPRAKL